MFQKNVESVTKGREGGREGGGGWWCRVWRGSGQSVVGRCSNHSHTEPLHTITHCVAKPFTHLLASQTYIPSHGLRHTPARSLIQNLVKSVFRPLSSLELLTDIKDSREWLKGTSTNAWQLCRHPPRSTGEFLLIRGQWGGEKLECFKLVINKWEDKVIEREQLVRKQRPNRRQRKRWDATVGVVVVGGGDRCADGHVVHSFLAKLVALYFSLWFND